MDRTPVVLEADDIQAVLDYAMSMHSASSTIVVCSTRAAFVEALQPQSEPAEPAERVVRGEEPAPLMPPTTSAFTNLTRPTLRHLANARTLKLAFCSDITHLRAYLAAYGMKSTGSLNERHDSSSDPRGVSVLAVLNPIQLHSLTTAMSAQGLNRTFSVAVEAAHRTASRLIIAECRPRVADENSFSDQADVAIEFGETDRPSNPWDEEVSILNVTTKSFGLGGRGWVGRTVTVRRIAERWCAFQRLNPHGDG